jgi:FAD/FMN-containing dehydrogenase
MPSTVHSLDVYYDDHFQSQLANVSEAVQSIMIKPESLYGRDNAEAAQNLTLGIVISPHNITIRGLHLGTKREMDLLINHLASKISIKANTKVRTLAWIEACARLAGVDNSEKLINDSTGVTVKQHNFYAKSCAIIDRHGLSVQQFQGWLGKLESYGGFNVPEGRSWSWYIIIHFCGGKHSRYNSHPAMVANRPLWTAQIWAEAPTQMMLPEDAIRFVDMVHRALVESGARVKPATRAYIDPKLTREEAQMIYFGDDLAELIKIKALLDPFDLFSNPHSIKATSK